MVAKPPVARRGCAVDCRCCAQRAVHLGRMRRKRGVWGEVDDVVSVGSRCWGRAVGLRQRGRPGWRRRCEGWLGQGRIDAGCKKAGPRRVPPQMTPFPPLGGAEIAVRGGVAAKLQTHWVKTVKIGRFGAMGLHFGGFGINRGVLFAREPAVASLNPQYRMQTRNLARGWGCPGSY